MKLFLFAFSFAFICYSFGQTLVKQSAVFEKDPASVLITAGGQKILSGSYDMKIYQLNVTSGQTEKDFSEHKGFVMALAYNEKANIIASAGWDQRIIIWDAATMTKKLDIAAHTDRINALAFSPDGMRIVSASDDKTVVVWDAMTGGEVFKLPGHTDAVTCVAFSNDGSLIASGGWDKSMTVHSASDGTLLRTYKGHRGGINTVAFSGNNQMLVSGSDDNSIIVWRSDTIQQLAKFDYFTAPVTRVVFFPGDQYIFCADGTGMLKVYHLANKSLLEQKEIHQGAVRDMYLNAASGLLVTSGADRIVKWWNVNEYLYFDCMKAKTKALEDLKKPKGEFETTEQYEKRVKEYERQKGLLASECAREAEAARKAQQDAAEKALLATYRFVNYSLTGVGTYNADTQEYPIMYNGLTAIVRIPMEEAKTLKENIAKAKIKAVSRDINGRNEVFNTELIHPVSGKSYPFGRQVSPAEDKLLGRFLQGAH